MREILKKEISQEQINLELESSYKPLAIESRITTLPLPDLGDREFEILAYFLVKKEIEDAKYPNITDISLMPGTAERGRDCVLYNNGIVCGLIQCKKYRGRLSRPQTLKEIIKFLLFSTFDNSILPIPNNFEYKLYVSNDLTEPAISLFHSYKIEIQTEISIGNIKKYTEDVINEYESFFLYKGNAPISKIEKLLKSIIVSYSNAIDLSARIYKQNSILFMFFNVKSIIDLEGANNLIRNAFEDYGLKYLTDEDLKILQERIGNTGEKDRINLGFVDFFGYSKEFFKYIKKNGFKELMISVTGVNSLLDKYQLNFIISKIHELILVKITDKLLKREKIHSFSIQVAAPYLFKRLTMKLLSKNMPKDMLPKYYPQFSMTKDELIDEIAQTLFETSEKVMKGDFSQLVGNPNEIDLKIKIYRELHSGFKDINDAKLTFLQDINLIRPVLDEIEDEIGVLIPEEKTIVIKDSSFFNNKREIEKLAKTIREID